MLNTDNMQRDRPNETTWEPITERTGGETMNLKQIAASAGFLTVAVFAGSAHAETAWKQMTVIEESARGTTTVIDLSKKGNSAGDLIVWHEPVVNESGKRIGTSNGFCITTLPGRLSECRWTLSLTDGTIALASTEATKGTSPAAIVGGTGIYVGVTGEAAVTPNANKTWTVQMKMKN